MDAERSRKTFRSIFQRVTERGQVHAAGAIGTSEATVSRMVSQLEQFAGLLTFAGLKVVPSEMQCYRPDYIDSLKAMAREHLNSDPKPPLEWD